MKKTRILVSSLLAAVMLVGAGYASWTDKLTINNTVTTGQLDVQFTEASVKSEYMLPEYENPEYQNDKQCIQSEGNKKLTVTLENIYPGLTYNFNATMKNSGTINAHINSVDYNTKGTAEIKGINKMDLTKMKDDEMAKITVKGQILYHIKNTVLEPRNIDSNLRDFQGDLSNILKDAAMDPNDTIEFKDVKICLPVGAVEKYEMQNEYVKFDLGINFGQSNIK